MIAPKGDRPNPSNRIGLRLASQTIAHTIPTSLPADLAEVVERWQSLTSEIRAEVLGLIRSDIPAHSRPNKTD